MQRDYILNETRKIALMLAKLMGLKTEESNEEFQQYFNEVLHDEYQTELAELLELSENEFAEKISTAKYSSEKLNALSQMLYVFAEPFTINDHTALLLKKVLILFNLLESEHHYESFDNLSKRNKIYSFFKNNYD
ncbi:hypothetical protein A0256_06890 [Mucilaginibacter sp. PAMC 26640]|nr:hypothetical protein A0256_06890 [Mucilaginibacter sp. PAMC 26640]